MYRGLSQSVSLLATVAVLAAATNSAHAEEKKGRTQKSQTESAKQNAQNPQSTPQNVPQAGAPGRGGSTVQLIVISRAGATQEQVDATLKSVDGKIVRKFPIGNMHCYLLEVDKSHFDTTFKKLSKDNNFQSVELNRPMTAH